MTKLIYLCFESGNGSILVDVSSAGLGFQAASPIEEATTIRFRLAAGQIDNIQLTGDLMWVDGTRKRGGLRFSHLPAEVKDEVGHWMRQTLSPRSELGDRVRAAAEHWPPPQKEKEQEALPNGARGSSAEDRSRTSTRLRSSQKPSDAESARASAAPGARAPRFSLDAPAPDATPTPEWPPYGARTRMRDEWVEGHSEHRAGAFALKIALFAIIAGGVFSFVNRQQAGEWLIRLGDKISGGQAQQSAKAEAVAPYSGAEATPTSSSSAVTPGQNKSTADAPPATRSDMPAGSGTVNSTAVAEPSPAGPDQATAPAARTQRLGDSNSGSETDAKKPTTDTRRNSPASSDENEGEEDFALAQRYLHGTNGPADSAIAAHLLWAAVGHGNTEAELQLANMYLRGEGVPQKNCQQARILLTAAYRNYKPLAGEKLAELREYGCP